VPADVVCVLAWLQALEGIAYAQSVVRESLASLGPPAFRKDALSAGPTWQGNTYDGYLHCQRKRGPGKTTIATNLARDFRKDDVVSL